MSSAGSHTACARFFGAAEALRERTNFRRDNADAEFLVPRIERSRMVLGAEAFAREQADGASWSYDDSLRQAGAALAAPALRSS